MFSDEDIGRLKLLALAIQNGHTISAVAQLGRADLEKLVASINASHEPKSTDGQQENGIGPDDKRSQTLVDRAVSHITRLESAQLEKLLAESAIRMPRQLFLEKMILPIFAQIGELWGKGRLKIVHEHMASVVIRAILWDMLRSIEPPQAAPKILVTTPIGHWHEFGALATALAASESGWQVVYFGPNLPSEEIVYAMQKSGAKALALSICHRVNVARLALELQKLRRLLGADAPIFVGGGGAIVAQRVIDSINAVLINDLRRFRDAIENLLTRKL